MNTKRELFLLAGLVVAFTIYMKAHKAKVVSNADNPNHNQGASDNLGFVNQDELP